MTDARIIGEAGGETILQAHVTGTPYPPRGRSKSYPRATSGSRREGYFHTSTDAKERRILDALDGDRWRLEFTSVTLITLAGLGDDQAGGSAGFITLDGLIHRWTANPTLGNGALAASTTYNVYAYISAGVVTLEAVATAPAPAAGYDRYSRKTADGTRVLVGLIKTNSASQFHPRGLASVRDCALGRIDFITHVFQFFNGGTPSVIYDTGTSRIKHRRTSTIAAVQTGQFRLRFQLPPNFSGFPSGAIRLITRASEIATSSMVATLYKAGVADAGITAVSVEPSVINTDQQFVLTPTGTYAPGDFLTFEVEMITNANNVTHDVGDLDIVYEAKDLKVE